MTKRSESEGAVGPGIVPAKSLEAAVAAAESATYDLVLYVAGSAPSSLRAIRNITRLCDQLIPGRYQLEIVDIYQQPLLAEESGIVAVPALIRTGPPPNTRLIGDLSDDTRVMAALGIRADPVAREHR